MIADKELEELQQFAELGRVSASLLHEISNPLTAALLHLELGDQDSVAIQRAWRTMKLLHRYVKAARQQVRRHSQRSRFHIQPQVNQLKPVLIPLARQAAVQLVLRPAPKCLLYGDPVKFQQILANLITNAIESYCGVPISTKPGRVELHWHHADSWLTIVVSDKGPGIAPQVLPHLFESFASTKTASGRGLGLGLATIKQHIETSFGGSIQAESRQRQGTRFTVKLPTVNQ